MLQLPLLRAGQAYRSLATVDLSHVGTGEPVASVSLANSGLIARDLKAAGRYRRAMQKLSVADLLEICAKAARMFVEADLPLDPIDGTTQSPDEYVSALSSTTGRRSNPTMRLCGPPAAFLHD